MRPENGQFKDLADGTDLTDAATIAQVPTWYVNNIASKGKKIYKGYATTSGGTAVFNLTLEGTSNGTAIFSTVDTDRGLMWAPDETTASVLISFASLSANKKVLTLNVSELSTVLLGIIQISAASNGRKIRVEVVGD